MPGTLINSAEFNTYEFKVKVATPCTCGAKQWFRCGCSDIVAEVTCYGTSPYEPLAEHIAKAREWYPGMTLIY